MWSSFSHRRAEAAAAIGRRTTVEADGRGGTKPSRAPSSKISDAEFSISIRTEALNRTGHPGGRTGRQLAKLALLSDLLFSKASEERSCSTSPHFFFSPACGQFRSPDLLDAAENVLAGCSESFRYLSDWRLEASFASAGFPVIQCLEIELVLKTSVLVDVTGQHPE